MIVIRTEDLEDGLPITREAAFGSHLDSSVHDLGHTSDKVQRWGVGFATAPKGFCNPKLFYWEEWESRKWKPEEKVLVASESR